MKKTAKLDFSVIGAQKAGTTSLHYELAKHPGIALPVEKEAPFFSDNHLFERGMDGYIDEFFPKASSEQLLGSVTPQYMSYPIVAERMWRHCPDARIIAILRDPVERARSHYKMRVRAFGEERSFKEAIQEQLEPGAIANAREHPTPSNSFVIWGEYGRILSNFLSFYPRNQLLVIFLSDFEKEQGNVLNSIYKFLDLESVESSEEGKRYNVASGGGESSLTVFFANAIQNTLLRRLGRRLIPEQLKRRLAFWSIINRNTSKIAGKVNTDLTDEMQIKLYRHYLSDLKILESIGVSSAPWRKRIEETEGSD